MQIPRFVPLFTAKITGDRVDYTSRRTGINYIITADNDGFNVDCPAARINIWTQHRMEALAYVQMVDLARLANL